MILYINLNNIYYHTKKIEKFIMKTNNKNKTALIILLEVKAFFKETSGRQG